MVAEVDKMVVGSIDAGIGGGGMSSSSDIWDQYKERGRKIEAAPCESTVIAKPTLAEGSFRASNSRCIHFFRIFGGMRSSASSAMGSPSSPPSGGSGGRGSDGGLSTGSDCGLDDDTIRLSMGVLDGFPADERTQ
jgi:hypothetical protein